MCTGNFHCMAPYLKPWTPIRIPKNEEEEEKGGRLDSSTAAPVWSALFCVLLGGQETLNPRPTTILG